MSLPLPPPPPLPATSPSGIFSPPSSSSSRNCRHCKCNVSKASYAEFGNLQVTNAYTINNIDDLWKWHSHLGSTLLSQYADLLSKFTDHLSLFIKQYNIRWCRAKANRFFLIRCLVCGSSVYGKYPDGSTEHASRSIAAIAAFMGQDVNGLVNSA